MRASVSSTDCAFIPDMISSERMDSKGFSICKPSSWIPKRVQEMHAIAGITQNPISGSRRSGRVNTQRQRKRDVCLAYCSGIGVCTMRSQAPMQALRSFTIVSIISRSREEKSRLSSVWIARISRASVLQTNSALLRTRCMACWSYESRQCTSSSSSSIFRPDASPPTRALRCEWRLSRCTCSRTTAGKIRIMQAMRLSRRMPIASLYTMPMRTRSRQRLTRRSQIFRPSQKRL
mmetsp:Transcript_20094/g.51780  ORF Transcript_20094/g.51780 Transcript_20094/m.51780 type:complete len:234 (+) Transcript_20094:201-902(+)